MHQDKRDYGTHPDAFLKGNSKWKFTELHRTEYDTPDNYYKRFRRGEIEQKDTFSKRELTEEPKFVRKKRAKAAETKQEQDVPTSVKSVSTSENENS